MRIHIAAIRALCIAANIYELCLRFFIVIIINDWDKFIKGGQKDWHATLHFRISY